MSRNFKKSFLCSNIKRCLNINKDFQDFLGSLLIFQSNDNVLAIISADAICCSSSKCAYIFSVVRYNIINNNFFSFFGRRLSHQKFRNRPITVVLLVVFGIIYLNKTVLFFVKFITVMKSFIVCFLCFRFFFGSSGICIFYPIITSIFRFVIVRIINTLHKQLTIVYIARKHSTNKRKNLC